MKNFKTLHEINLSDTAMVFLVYKFASLIKKTYTEWDAYKLGLIDEKGEVIRKPKTTEEKNSFGKVESFVLKVKNILLKYIRSEKLLSILVYAYILKNESAKSIAIIELEEQLSEEELNDLQEFLSKLPETEY
jgi:hypothetical protein